jgi:hypothetical protein
MVVSMKKPTLLVRCQTIDEEIRYIISLIKDKEFFRQNGYSVKLPDHTKFKEVFLRDEIADSDLDELRQIFINEIYSPTDYEVGVRTITSCVDDLRLVWEKFEAWNNAWNFSLYPKYQILLTLYGTGGMYLPDDSKIIMMTDKNGQFQNSNPLETVIHELVHLGIEEPIVNGFDFSHWEKEKVVDLLCKHSFSSIIPNYQLQQIDNSHLDNLISAISIEHLPEVIEKYTTNKK